MFGYFVPEPDEALLITGGKGATPDSPRVVIGKAAFAMPMFRKVRRMSLSMVTSQIEVDDCVSTQGIKLNVRGVISYRVMDNVDSIVAASRRFLGDSAKPEQQRHNMSKSAEDIFAGQLRGIVGTMNVEDLIRDRLKLRAAVLDAAQDLMGNLGLYVDSFEINSIDDRGSGYIDNLSAGARAEAERTAKIERANREAEAAVATSEADRRASEAAQVAARAKADYERETALKMASIQAETDKATAEAAQAGPLAKARADREIATAQAELAREYAAQREEELVSEVVKPAEAAATARRIEAEAEAAAMKTRAEAAAAEGRISLDEMLITQLPELVRAASASLSGANLTVVNGTEGVNDVLTGTVTQGIALLNAVKNQLANSASASDADAQARFDRNPQVAAAVQRAEQELADGNGVDVEIPNS